MKWLKVNNIVIVGGGISGWLSALALRKLSHDLNVTLIIVFVPIRLFLITNLVELI